MKAEVKCIVNKEPYKGGFILWVAGVGEVGFYVKEKDANKYCKEINEVADISFKAGIKEVIDYLIQDDNGLVIQIKGDKWGKKLKEWNDS